MQKQNEQPEFKIIPTQSVWLPTDEHQNLETTEKNNLFYISEQSFFAAHTAWLDKISQFQMIPVGSKHFPFIFKQQKKDILSKLLKEPIFLKKVMNISRYIFELICALNNNVPNDLNAVGDCYPFHWYNKHYLLNLISEIKIDNNWIGKFELPRDCVVSLREIPKNIIAETMDEKYVFDELRRDFRDKLPMCLPTAAVYHSIALEDYLYCYICCPHKHNHYRKILGRPPSFP